MSARSASARTFQTPVQPALGSPGLSTPRWIRYALMPTTLIAGLGACRALDAAGVSRSFVLVLVTLATAVVLGVLERLYPMRADWRLGDGQTLQDIGHALLGSILGIRLGDLLAVAIAFVIVGRERASVGGMAQLPLVLQIGIALLVADLGRYLQHRALHSVSWLWRIHQMHHSVAVLNVFKTGRNHALERFSAQLAMYVPLFVLGTSEQALFYFGALNGMLGYFAHANLDCRIGALELVVSGPGAHRLHHSKDLHEGHCNFGTALVVWDRLWGTYANPRERFVSGAPPFEVGIARDEHPRSFLRQILWPFSRSRHIPKE